MEGEELTHSAGFVSKGPGLAVGFGIQGPVGGCDRGRKTGIHGLAAEAILDN